MRLARRGYRKLYRSFYIIFVLLFQIDILKNNKYNNNNLKIASPCGQFHEALAPY